MINKNLPTLLADNNLIVTDTWFKASWEKFSDLAHDSQYDLGRFYYDNGWMKIEMSPIGIAHAEDNSIISTVIILYGALKNIQIKELTNCSYRKTGVRECQPDISYYLGENYPNLARNNSPIDLNQTPPPSLAIEIGSSSFLDELGKKRLMYEQLAVKEYWVINVSESEIIAFSIHNQGSYQIKESKVLPGLSLALVEEALKLSQQQDHGAITRWLISQWKA